MRTVVWVTPWVNLDSSDGQRPARRRVRAPAPRAGGQLRRGRRGRPLRPRRRRRALRRRAGGWAPGPRSTSPPPPRERWWREQAQAGARARASRGSRPTTARATTSRRTPASPTAAAAPRPPGRTASLYRRTMQGALDDVHRRRRGALRAIGLGGPAGDRDALGRRPGLGLLVAARRWSPRP